MKDVLESYAERHSHPRNLLIHALAVPVFIAGTAGVVAGALSREWPVVAGGLLAMLVSIAVQGRGHRHERVPFVARGPGHFLRAILVEQLFTFPRFVLSGAFARTWRRSTHATISPLTQ